MLMDGILLADDSVITNTHVERAATFPINPTSGLMFYLTETNSSFSPGLYIYDGSKWTTGDISSVSVGYGLTGGGASGDITVDIDTNVIALKSYVDTIASQAGSGDFKADGTVPMTGSLVANSGSKTNQSIKIGKNISNIPSGFYSINDNEGSIGFSVDNTLRLTFGSAGIQGNPSAPAHVGLGIGGYYGWVTDQLTGLDHGNDLGTFNLRSTNSIIAKVSGTGIEIQSGKNLTLSADPTSNLHAATKQYVDVAISSISPGTLAIINGGTGATTAEGATTNLGAARINPTTAKTGDIKVVTGVISMYDGSAWKQIYPAVYA